MRTVLTILSVLLISIKVSFGFDTKDSLKTQEIIIQQVVEKILLQDQQNRINEQKGNAAKNNYVINIDTEHWIEERGAAKTKLLDEEAFARMSQNLQEFNNRKDGLRFYVIVINDYVVKFKTRIDPSLISESFRWNDLKNYPDQRKVVKELWHKTSNLINGISTALQSKGFPERMIYFYSQLKVEEYDKTSHFYKYDRLSFIGKAIEPLQDNIRERVKVPSYGAVTNIEVAISNIIKGANAVIEGEEETPAIDCSQSIDKIAENTKTIRGKEYDQQVAAFASLLDKPSSAQQKGSPYMIVDQPDNFGDDNVFLQEILPDKVALLAQDGNSDYKLYIVFKEVKFVMPASDWAGFAKSVALKSTIGKQSNTILMVVPYFKTVCKNGTNWLGMSVSAGTGITMAAVYTSTKLNSSMNAALATSSTSWAKMFDEAYSKIPKKYKTYDYKFLWNGDLINDGFTDRGTVTGKANIVEVRILEDARFEQLQTAWNQYVMAATSAGGSPAMGAMVISTQQLDQLYEQADIYNKKVDAILSKRPEFFYVTKTNLVESKLSKKIADEFTFWYAKHKKWGFAAYFVSPEDEIFYGGKNPENVEDALILIDIASGITSFVGADFIFDGIGAYYAYSNDEYAQATFYTAAAAVPFLSSAVRRAVMEGGTYVLKTAKGTYVTIPKGVLGMNYLFEVNDAFSQFMKTALNMKSFSKAAKYKTETKFLEALEDGLIADNNAIKALNDNPDLVDEFNAFHKAGKGGLKEFLGKDAEQITRRVLKAQDASQIGAVGSTIKISLIDDVGNVTGELKRVPGPGSEFNYYFTDFNGGNGLIKNQQYALQSKAKIITSASPGGYSVPNGQSILYMDFNLPKSISDNYSGLGKMMFDDAFIYFGRNGKVDGIYGEWIKNAELYQDYGGMSVNLKKFQDAYSTGLTKEQAAFETITGQWAKSKEFKTVNFRILDLENGRIEVIFSK